MKRNYALFPDVAMGIQRIKCVFLIQRSLFRRLTLKIWNSFTSRRRFLITAMFVSFPDVARSFQAWNRSQKLNVECEWILNIKRNFIATGEHRSWSLTPLPWIPREYKGERKWFRFVQLTLLGSEYAVPLCVFGNAHQEVPKPKWPCRRSIERLCCFYKDPGAGEEQ